VLAGNTSLGILTPLSGVALLFDRHNLLDSRPQHKRIHQVFRWIMSSGLPPIGVS
jgi:hypothetical protein